METYIEKIDRDRYKTRMEKISLNKRILPSNRAKIAKYLNTKANMAYVTKLAEIRCLRMIGEYFTKVEFTKATDDDLNQFFNHTRDISTKRVYNDWIDKTRRFFKWIYDTDGLCNWCGKPLEDHTRPCIRQPRYPKPVDKLKKTNGVKPITQASDLLTQQEVNEILNACTDLKHRCYFHILWETGFRPRELCSVNYEDVKAKDEGFLITVRKSKTEPRTIWLIESRNDLDLWLKQHPYKDGHPLFCHRNPKKKDRNLLPSYIHAYLKRIQPMTSIKKNIMPYLFRKSRATLLAKKGWNTAQIERYMGWSPNSPCLNTYVRLSREDIEDRQRVDAGMIKTEAIASTTTNCPWCEATNESVNERCYACKREMDTKKVIQRVENNNVQAIDLAKQLLPLMQTMIHQEVLKARKTPIGEIGVICASNVESSSF
ncbi:site-specific integrase [Candidatus Woesearchaeota archaeon]|jgi:integrase|nr:site-specific integrase [Candidatus Woesearchaeota archaeon]